MRAYDFAFAHASRPAKRRVSAILLGALLLGALASGVAATDRSNAGPLYQHCESYHRQYQVLERKDAVAASWKAIGPRSYKLGNMALFGGVGRILSLAFDPSDKDVIYAGAGTGPLWRSRDAGKTWEPISHALGISGIAVAPTEPRQIYILSGSGSGGDGNSYYVTSSGVFKATDNGGSFQWTQTESLTAKDYLGYELEMSPKDPDILYVPTNRGLYQTLNGGEEWRRVLPGLVFDMEFNLKDPNIVYAASVQKDWTGPAEIRISVEGGKKGTWMLAKSIDDLGTYPRIELAVTPDNPDLVYAIVGSGNGFRGLYRSKLGGREFEIVSNTPGVFGWDEWIPWGYSFSGYQQVWMNLNLAVNPEDANDIWVGSLTSWHSADGGTSWEPGTVWNERVPVLHGWALHIDFHDLQFHDGHLFATTDGGIYRRDKDKNLWTDLTAGLDITQIYKLCGPPEDAGILYLGAQDGGTMRLDDRKSGAATTIFNFDGMGCIVNAEKPEEIYVSGNEGIIFKSADGGERFTATAPLGVSGKGAWTTPYNAFPRDPKRIFACYSEVWETRNGGGLWTQISEDGAAGQGLCADIAVAAFEGDPNPSIYTARGCSIYKGTEVSAGEETWDREWEWNEILSEYDASQLLGQGSCDPAGKPSIRELEINPRNPDEIWITFNGFKEDKKVYRGIPETYRDPAAVETYRWTNISGSRLPNVAANTLIFSGDSANGVYLGMDCGLFYLDDTLTDWVPFFEGLPWPNTMVEDLLLQRDRETGEKILRAATFSQGVWESPTYTSRKRQLREDER